MFDVFEEIWRGMKHSKMITEEEYLHTNFPQYYRTKEEFLAPFEDPTNPVRTLGLVVERCETAVVKCPYREAYDEGGYQKGQESQKSEEGNEEAERFAEAYIKTLRSWSEGVFFAGLDKRRTPETKAAIVDSLYDRYREAVAAHPYKHSMDYVHCYMLIKKERSLK